ncbi:hypothetical protein H6G35_25950 [Aulosira sp. FACHB-113]|nr:hypothetical protein [Aulosira sp. FACHB-113]
MYPSCFPTKHHKFILREVTLALDKCCDRITQPEISCIYPMSINSSFPTFKIAIAADAL